jgi:Xaa-Pro aminopeptidase
MKSETIKKRIKVLRDLMQEKNIHGYIIPGTDTHHNEYIPAVWKRREWISGFSGSNGDVVVTIQKAGLWTDSRYFIQADMELALTGIDLYKLGHSGTKEIHHWIQDELRSGESLGIDPALFSQERVKKLNKVCKEKGIELRFLRHNLVDLIWEDKPPIPSEKAEVIDISFCGESFEEKIERLREKMGEAGCGFHIITSLDAIAWLLNIRGSDISYNPLLIAYVIVTRTEVKLFTRLEKITEDVRAHLKDVVRIYDYGLFMDHCVFHAEEEERVWIDPEKTSYDIILGIKDRCRIYYSKSPVIFFKAVKNSTEIACLQKAHVRDGAAMVRFLAWLEKTLAGGKVTELSAEKRLEAFRKENRNFRGLSFRTISAFGDHGAIVHYSASEKTDQPIS